MNFDEIFENYQIKNSLENKSFIEIHDLINSKIFNLHSIILYNLKNSKKNIFRLKLIEKISKDNYAISIYAYKNLINTLNTYKKILFALSNILNKYSIKLDKSIKGYQFLNSIIDVVMDTFLYDINIDINIEPKHNLEKNTVNNYQVYKLIDFLKIKIASYEEIDFNSFYERMLKK